MGSKLFIQFIRKALVKQGAPGPPPRQGLQWKPQTHRWIRPKDASTVSEVSDDQPVKPSTGWESPLHEIAYENIRDEIQMSGIPEAEHFNNAKEYASYIDSSVWQSMIDIRNDMEDEEDYFKRNVGFEDTEENIDAYMTALEETAKDYAENVVDQDAYGTGVHVDEMTDEDYDDDDDDDKASQAKNFFRGLAEEYNTSELREDFSETRTDYGPFDTDIESETIDFYAWLESSIKDDLWGGKFEDKLESMGIDSQNEEQAEGFLSQGIKNYARAQGDIINPMTGRLK